MCSLTVTGTQFSHFLSELLAVETFKTSAFLEKHISKFDREPRCSRTTHGQENCVKVSAAEVCLRQACNTCHRCIRELEVVVDSLN